MAFIDTSETIIVAEVPQIYARYIEPGQMVEIAFKFLPGSIRTDKVETVLQAVATGQAAPSGPAAPLRELSAAPFIMRVRLNDEGVAEQLPAGSVGTAASTRIMSARVISSGR
jgi:predicted naringenin-chalcone synthase